MADPANILTPLLMLVQSILSPPAPPSQPAEIRNDERQIVECIGQYESGGNYGAVSTSGKYRGKYQMNNEFFLGHGGDPAFAGRHEQAPPAMQDEVALRGYQARGFDPWPGAEEACSR